MLIRRLFYRWQFLAVVVLPLWLVIGWAVFGAGGWGTLGLVITVPASFLTLLVIALLVNARPTVRSERAASWTDVGVLGAWQLAIVGTGFYAAGSPAFGVLAVVGAVAAFWVTIWQLVADGSRRMRATMAEFERQAAAARPGTGSSGVGSDASGPGRFADGEVIVVHEVRDRDPE
jgi:hypothetical protein